MTLPTQPQPVSESAARNVRTVAKVTALYVYPIKSAAGTLVQEARVEPSGFAADRRWMVVDAKGTFVTQRQLARLALIRPRIAADRLLVDAPNMPTLDMPLTLDDGENVQVRIWKDTATAWRWTGDGRAWMSEVLQGDYEPVFLPAARARQVDLDYARPGDRVAFADAYPFMILSQASLDDLNDRLAEPLPMNRFRPSIVVDGCPAFGEDAWGAVKVGEIAMHIVKPCVRCRTTTVDQDTAETAVEPLRTLATYRKRGKGVNFGQNAVHDNGGVLRVGDAVQTDGAGATAGDT